ncbi:VOC family protein [Ruania zhangjianzhongii]|uniref:VOC family protein n=1 Tax=Ruania zhangjianzhongii TaxID=2603206 RepID=UPI001AEF58A7|nr:VOC family protein [Ruania zhangjianzhongii]
MTAQEFGAADGVGDWRVLGEVASAWFSAPSHAAGAALARPLADLDVPVDLSVRATGVRADIVPTGGMLGTTEMSAAREVSAAARALDLAADPAVLQSLRLTFDVLDRAAVQPFWETVLGYVPRGVADIADPLRRGPTISFQDQGEPRPLRNRLHLDAVTPQPVAQAALEAVRERSAGSIAEHGFYATVADAEGNEADLLPLQDGADGWGEPETEDWRLVFSAMAWYRVDSTGQAADLISAAAELADEAKLALGIDLRPGFVVLDTGKDLWEQDDGYEVLATRIQERARALGLTADVTKPRFVQVGIDAADIPAVRRFWCAVLGYQEDPRAEVTDIIDPRQLTMPLFFQAVDATETGRLAQRNRIHLDAFVPGDQARARVAAGLAAGGSLLSDEHAPAWWTLADPEGNEVDISVASGRRHHRTG